MTGNGVREIIGEAFSSEDNRSKECAMDLKLM
jgi:hypothetical protein